jgi:tetratricopeptide (TPR) repeat protein
MKKKLIFCVLLLSNICLAKEKTNLVHDPFTVFYPHLGDNHCRGEAFNIVWEPQLNYKQKISKWSKYKKTCSTDGSYQLILADIQSSYDNDVIAEKTLESSIQNANFDTRYHKSLLHEVYINLKKIDQSLHLAYSIIDEYPDFYGGYQSLAVNFIQKKDWLNAKQYLEKSLLLNKNNSATYSLLAMVSYELREDNKVYKYYEKALSLDPFRVFADKHSTMRMAAVFILEKKFDTAKELLSNLLELNPSVKDDHSFLGLMQQCDEGLIDMAKN